MNQTERAILQLIQAELREKKITRQNLVKIYWLIHSGEYLAPKRDVR